MNTLHIKITGSDNLLATIYSNLYAVLNLEKEQPVELDVRKGKEIDQIEEFDLKNVLKEMND